MDKINKLKELLTLLQNDTLKPSDIKSFLEVVLKVVKDAKDNTEKVSNETQKTLKDAIAFLSKEHEKLISQVNSETDTKITKYEKKINEVLSKAEKALENISKIEIRDGRDADEQKIVEEVLNKIEIPLPESETPKEIKDKLESLKGDKRLDISAIKGGEKLTTQENVDRAISILDQRTQYLINKKTSSGTGAVSSVNGQTGDVVLTIPTDTSELTNGAGFIDSSMVPTYETDPVWTSEKGSYAQLAGATFTGGISATNLSGTNTGDQVGDGVTITGTGTVADPFVAVAGGGDMLSSTYDPAGGAKQVAFADELTTLTNRFNGACQIPTITDNGDGTVTLGDGDYCLSSLASGDGIINTYSISGATYSLTDLAMNYIVADYNGGTPIVHVISDVNLINETTVVPIYSIFRNGIYLHTQNWDALGLALANKVHQSIVKTQRYRRQSGLSLSESGTRNLNLTSGIIWTGAVPMTLDAVASATDNIFLWYHSSGNWTVSTPTQYNNTQYDNGTNLVSLGVNRYAVNWIYRGVESQKHLYVVLGTGDYTLNQAESATVPAIPLAISSHAVLVGKLIVQNGSNTATSIQSAFDTQFSLSSVQSHSDLTNLDYANSGHTGFASTTDLASYLKLDQTTPQTTVGRFTFPTVNIGSSTAITTNVTAPFQVVGTNAATSQILSARFSDDANPPGYQTAKARGTISSPSAVIDGDSLYTLAGYGYTSGGTYHQSTLIQGLVTGTPSATRVPSALTFATSNTTSGQVERMRISADGMVGIGTTSPDSKLTIIDSNYPVIKAIRTTSDTNSIRGVGLMEHSTTSDMVDGFGSTFEFSIKDSSNISNTIGSFGAIRDGADNTGALIFRPFVSGVGTERMRITSTGNVGINTTSPLGILHIVEPTLANIPILERSSVTSNALFATAGLLATKTTDMGDGFGPSFLLQIRDDAGVVNPIAFFGASRDGADNSGAFRIATYLNGVATERMRVSSSGFVGIGAISPRTKLELLDGNFIMTDSDVVHGMTNYFYQNTYGNFGPLSQTAGGFQLAGVSDTDATGIVIQGVMGTETPTATTPAVVLKAQKQITSTATVQAIGATETALTIQNDTTRLITVLGSGNTTFAGSIGLTGTRISKGWFTDIESTNMPTVGGTAILSSLTAPQFTTIELGHATDTTLSRASAGVIAVEGVTIPTISSTNTLTNKRITKRVASTTDDSTAEIDCDSYDEYYLTAIANNTTISITGTPTAGQTIFIGLKDAGTSKTLTWSSITGLGQTLPSATTAGKQHIIGLKYIASAWRAIAVNVEA